MSVAHCVGRKPTFERGAPEGKAVSTMPPNILASLPKLAHDIEYRFVERHLILLDRRARVILDRIPYAIPVFDSKTTCR
jgi:hypothetical protein